jgi:hypothetical protein
MSQAALLHPPSFSTRSVEAGYFASSAVGRRGRAVSSPPQFGHWPAKTVVAHVVQKVHSNEHICASALSGGRSALQHSQFGLSCSI